MAIESYEQEALRRSELALRQKALEPLATSFQPLSFQGDQDFELRNLTSALPKHLRQAGPKPNPFLPWDPRLEVCAVGEHHALILNKYPVQLGHMLLVTRAWAPQTDWLQQQDWNAIGAVDSNTTGLWFFNSGPAAGASQPHRHVQLLPRRPGDRVCPRSAWFELAIKSDDANSQRRSGVEQAMRVIKRDTNHPSQPDHLLTLYRTLSHQLGLGDPCGVGRPSAPYNLLMTRSWMAMVRRRCDGMHGFSVNALGFAGYLLATAQSDLDWLQTNGPNALLSGVVEPFSENTVAKKS